MPKTENLTMRLGIKGPGATTIRDCMCDFQWEGRFLKYKLGIWKRIDLSRVQEWKVSLGRGPSSRGRRQYGKLYQRTDVWI